MSAYHKKSEDGTRAAFHEGAAIEMRAFLWERGDHSGSPRLGRHVFDFPN